MRDDLRLVGKIRYRFAHDLNASFDKDPVCNWVLLLKWHERSMQMSPPAGASPSAIFQVRVNQLVAHLSGIVGIARLEKRELHRET